MSSRKLIVSLLILFFIHFSFEAKSQSTEKRIYNTAFAKTAPEIDGHLNDACWEQTD